MRGFALLLIAVLLSAAVATAERYRFRHYGPDEGLNREHCLSAGMDDYISKPISIRTVTEVIDWVSRSLEENWPRMDTDQRG